jgi:hypothetical protein
MDHPFERVYTVTDYYDGPRSGVADFGGAPHAYRALFSEAADEGEPELFELSPLTREAFALALEDWEIWCRFERRYHRGEVAWSGAEDEWGALPEELARHREIRPVLDRVMAIDPASRIVARAEFRAMKLEPADALSGILRPLKVRWVPVE